MSSSDMILTSKARLWSSLISTFEGLRNPGFHDVLAFDDGLVGLHAAQHIVGLDRKQFLQHIGRTVGLKAQTSISPKRWPPNWALPPRGCWVIRL